MKITKYDYVYEPTPGYYYFRRGKLRLPLNGIPGTREFQEAYDDAISQHAPQLRKKIRGRGAAKGTVDYVIVEFKKSDKWQGLGPDPFSESTKEIYTRRFDWLSDNYGGEMLAAFDRRLIKRIRNLPEFADKTSVADAIVDRIGALWNFADEILDIELPGHNPTIGIKPRHEEGDPAPAWPAELCAAFEKQDHKRMVTFYFLGRYAGQRRGDCCAMKKKHFDPKTGEMHVVQEKTGTRIWVPCPDRLLDYLAPILPTLAANDYILQSPKGGKYAKTSVTNIVCDITAELGFSNTDSKGKLRGYSPHGLRHLCGAELAEAGCTTQQIMAILGHLTERQAQRYVEQANKRRMARDGNDKRNAMYRRDEREAQIAAAGNVRKLRAANK